MKKMLKFAGVAVATLALTQTMQATPINGAIGFTGNVTWNTSSAENATQVTSWIGTQVLSDSGDFASFITPIAAAVFNNSVIWNLNDPSTTISAFWTAGGFTFDLSSSVIASQGGTPGVNGFVVVDGTGTVSGNGFTPTTLSWIFNSQDPQSGKTPPQWTFSASANSTIPSVPDGGTTAMLLGLGLSSVALLKKKLAA